MKNNFDINKLSSQIMRSSGGKINNGDIERLKRGDMSPLMGSLSEKDRQNLKRALNDKELANRILSSKQAQDLMDLFKKGNGKNG